MKIIMKKIMEMIMIIFNQENEKDKNLKLNFEGEEILRNKKGKIKFK
jgi:hypothetical protein